jgi:transposase-like protein
MAECDAPGSSVKALANRHDMATSVLHRWRLLRKNARAKAVTPMQFVAFGDIDHIVSDARQSGAVDVSQLPREPSPALTRVGQARASTGAEHDARLLPHPGGAPGTIAIAFGPDLRVSVDSYVNEKALARVLRTLKVIA